MRTLTCACFLTLLSGCLFITVDPDDWPLPEDTDGGPSDAGNPADACPLPDRDCSDWVDVDAQPCEDCAAPPAGCHYEGGIPCLSCGTLVCDDDACREPTNPTSCDEVGSFQCGFMAECRDGVLYATWHEHWWCPGVEPGSVPENISNYACSYACPGGCAEGELYDWPQDGTALVSDHCTPIDEVDAGSQDASPCLAECTLPFGCHYEGEVSCESCGTLVCDDAGYACTCPEPAPGCHVEGRDLELCLCGDVVCADGGVE